MVTPGEVKELMQAATPQETTYAELKTGRIVKMYGMFSNESLKLLYSCIALDKVDRVFRSLMSNLDTPNRKLAKFNPMFY